MYENQEFSFGKYLPLLKLVFLGATEYELV